MMYSQLKPLWHQDRLNELKEGGRVRPIHVQLILSDLCNQDCHFCAYRMSEGLSNELFSTEETHNPNRKIPRPKALEILADCREIGVKAIQFTGGGEPTVHPDHLEIFEKAQSLGMSTALVTNGVRLSPRSQAVSGMEWIRVSIDAGTAGTYSAIRRVPESHWKRVWSNVAELSRSYGGTLGVGFVVTTANFREIGLAAKLCKEHGVSNMRVGAVFSSMGLDYYGGTIESIRHAIDDAKRLEDSGFKVIDLFGRRLGDLSDASPDYTFCGYQYLTLYIGADLNVYRCCNTAYTTRGILGSLKNNSLSRAWRKFSYDGFDARGCKACQFNGQNRLINAAIAEPTHSEFV